MSKISTSIEQGKRLLDAGIDPKSADMYWDRSDMSNYTGFEWLREEPHPMLSKNEKYVYEQPDHFPLAWSLSALITLLPEHAFWRIARVREKDVEGMFEDIVEYLTKEK